MGARATDSANSRAELANTILSDPAFDEYEGLNTDIIAAYIDNFFGEDAWSDPSQIYEDLINQATEGTFNEKWVENYSKNNKTYSDTAHESIEDQLEALEMEEETWENFLDAFADANGLDKTDEHVQQLAMRILELNSGLDELLTNWDENIEAINEYGMASEEGADAITSLQDSIKTMLGVEVSGSFIKDNLDVLQEFADGDYSNLTSFMTDATKDFIQNGLELSGSEEDKEQVRADLAAWTNEVASVLPDLEIGADLNIDGFIDSLNEMLKAGTITAETLLTVLEGMGVDGEVTLDENNVPSISFVRKGVSTKSLNANNLKGTAGKSSSSSSGSANVIERYYTISRQVEKLNDQLEDLADVEDRVFSQEKVDAMQAQIDKYNELLAANRAYLAEAEAYLAQDRAAIEAYGAIFDANGIITNYNEMFASYGQNDDFIDALEQYEETLNQVDELNSTIQSTLNDIYDKSLEIITYKVEFQISIDDMGITYFEFLLEQLDDAAYDTAESLSVLSKEMSNYQQQYDTYVEGIEDILSLASGGDGTAILNGLINGTMTPEEVAQELNLTEEAFENLVDYYEQILEMATNIKKTWDAHIEQMQEFWDTWGEKFDDEIERAEYYGEVAEHYRDLIDTLGKDNYGISNETLARLDDAASTAAIQAASTAYAKYNAAKEAYEEAVSNGLDEEIIEHYQEAMDEAYADVLDKQASAADQLQTEYDNALEIIFET